MKKTLLMIALLTFASSLHARDDVNDYSVKDAMSNDKVSSAIGDGVSFYFGNQKHPAVQKKFGEFRSNKKTNAFNKTDQAACEWAFASAMKTLKQRAVREGGNAVINIRSNYRDNVTSSNTTFKCGSGNVVAGVALIGEVVKVAK